MIGDADPGSERVDNFISRARMMLHNEVCLKERGMSACSPSFIVSDCVIGGGSSCLSLVPVFS